MIEIIIAFYLAGSVSMKHHVAIFEVNTCTVVLYDDE
jgi:uncharacterized membrane protein